ncbi:MAG: hypothetical protein U0133_06070 [Gemmatimonadales bacterium]
MGEGAKTVIPAAATAKAALPLGAGSHAARWPERAAKAAAPKYAEVDVKILHGGDPVEVDTMHPSFAVLDQAFKEIAGKPPVRVRAGGSTIIPRLGQKRKRR